MARSGRDAYTAPHEVLAVTELLESILSALPPQKIFVVQRVCTAWHRLIKDSPTLQQKMHLIPNGELLAPMFELPKQFDDPDEDWVARYSTRDISFSPFTTFFKVRFPALSQEEYDSEDDEECDIDTLDDSDTEPQRTSESKRTFRTASLEMFPNYKNKMPDIEIPNRGGPFAVKATWIRTLVSQPPVTAVTIAYEDWREGWPWGFTVENLEGLTLGDLYQASREGREQYDLTPGKRSLGMCARILLRLECGY